MPDPTKKTEGKSRRPDAVDLDPERTWRRVLVEGIVQGIGFRPTVFRLARRHGLVGEVRNTAHGVELLLGGNDAAVRRFLDQLPRAIPASGRIEWLDERPTDPLPGCDGFSIAPSVGDETIDVVIPPDQATCPDCLRELRDPENRRFGYPLITCTICGPRYSIIADLPYDRERTTMHPFPLCDRCRDEYERTDDRRFHAESIACARCGPNVELISPEGPVDCGNPIDAAIEHLKTGRIVAIKGIGGYHLACDAANEAAIAKLRRRKRRPHKPFAILVRNLKTTKRFCRASQTEAALLTSPEAPIVLLRRRGEGLPQNLAPDNDRLGVMLPYTPIQHLLAGHFDALVMTSGNVSDEPIRYTEEGVRELLGGSDSQFAIADFALVHPREIVNPSDDSVCAVQRGGPVLLRRARGHVPTPLTAGKNLPPILAVGADLKNACAFGLGRHVYCSPHIGDLEYPAAFARHVEEIERFGRWFGEAPRAVACDVHPGYLSTQNAHRLAEQWGARLIEVQHHHAHIASCLAEHGSHGEVIGVAFDGAGHGTDGAVWGGEFLVASRAKFRRLGRLAYHSMPGGEKSIREPWRMLAAYLIELFGEDKAKETFDRYVGNARRLGGIAAVLEGSIPPPRTSSMGRLFDAVGVLLGFAAEVSFEAQNAMALESLCTGSVRSSYPIDFRSLALHGPDGEEEPFEIQLYGLFDAVVDDLDAGTEREVIANRFHKTIVEMIVYGCSEINEQTGLTRVALSGGCFMNTVLVERAVARLEAGGYEVLRHRSVPPNDGGVALGQIAVAAARLAADEA